MKTIKEIEKLAKNNESYLAYNYVDGFIDGYTQSQEDIIQALEKHITAYEHEWIKNPKAQLKNFIYSNNI